MKRVSVASTLSIFTLMAVAAGGPAPGSFSGQVSSIGPAAAEAAKSKRARAIKRARRARLRAFGSCTGLLNYFRNTASSEAGYWRQFERPVMQAPGGDGDVAMPMTTKAKEEAPSAPESGDNYSKTNVQEAGVDEPDIVKSDGSRIYAVASGKLYVVDVRQGKPKIAGKIELDGYGHEILLHKGHVLAISTSYDGTNGTVTVISEVDVSDPASMSVVRGQRVDGSYVSARSNGDIAHVVISTTPKVLKEGKEEAMQAGVEQWLPTTEVTRRGMETGPARKIAPCRDVYRSRAFSGLNSMSVLTINLAKGLPAVDTDVVMTDAETVYASSESLYVATEKFDDLQMNEGPPPKVATSVHKFDISGGDETEFRASGSVPGYLLSQWSLSEQDGILRVASTSEPSWWGGDGEEQSESFVTTLEEAGGALVKAGQIGNLGRGEEIYAVRFIGDVGYVVTFRRTDPLYTIDLSNPQEPKVLGELKIMGYSAYLHPVGDDLLIGVGQDATESGRRLGVQLSLFDVSDLRKPVRIHQRNVGSKWSSSDAEYDHHAFLYWPRTKLLAMPLSDYRDNYENSAVGFQVDRAKGISEVGKIVHESGGRSNYDDYYDYYNSAISRILVVDDRIYTLSDNGLKSSDLTTFADRGWVSFD